MQRCLLYVFLFLIIFSGCNQHNKWTENDINTKLKAIFPSANRFKILDSISSKQDTTDGLNMPLPAYKVLVSEETDTNARFVFYFYNVSVIDSTFSKVFRQFMLNALKTGLGTAKSEYLCEMPQYDKTGNKLIAFAVSLNISDEKYIADKEKKITKIFELQETKVRDIKLEEIKD